MKNLMMALAAVMLTAAGAEAATTIVPKPASPPAVSSGTAPAPAGTPASSETVGVTPSTAPAAAPQGAAPGGGAFYPACADEISKYCPNDLGQDQVNACLTRNAGRLSDACKRSRAGQ